MDAIKRLYFNNFVIFLRTWLYPTRVITWFEYFHNVEKLRNKNEFPFPFQILSPPNILQQFPTTELESSETTNLYPYHSPFPSYPTPSFHPPPIQFHLNSLQRKEDTTREQEKPKKKFQFQKFTRKEKKKISIRPTHEEVSASREIRARKPSSVDRHVKTDGRTERGGLESSGESRIEGSCTTGRAAVSVKRLTMMDGYAWCVWVKPPPVLAWPGLAWPGPARGAAHMRAQPAPTELLLSLHLCTTPLRYATPRRPPSPLPLSSANFSTLLTFSQWMETPFRLESAFESKSLRFRSALRGGGLVLDFWIFARFQVEEYNEWK